MAGDPAAQTDAEAARTRTIPLVADQGATLEALAGSALAGELLGADIRDALLAVRRHEHDTYAKEDSAVLADRFRFTWSV